MHFVKTARLRRLARQAARRTRFGEPQNEVSRLGLFACAKNADLLDRIRTFPQAAVSIKSPAATEINM